MKSVVHAAVLLTSLAMPAWATCVISPDGKSIDVVTDNGDTSEKNCAVKCRVDTKIGAVQVSCGGNTPPLAKAHSLCNFDKPEPYYKKVLSSEDSCKPAPAGAAAPVERNAAPLPKTANPAKPSFACRIAADGKSAEAVIANPYAEETSCSVDCQISTTRGHDLQPVLHQERRGGRRRDGAVRASGRAGHARQDDGRQGVLREAACGGGGRRREEGRR